MSGALSAKKLLSQYNEEQYRAFLLNDEEQLCLTVTSSVPGIGASQRKDNYKKTISHPDSSQHVKFITKNDEAHSFVWQTKPQQLKNAVRWGIIKTHSITSKVIAALGQYRVLAHERVAKGMISNSQVVKLKLLDLYQDRFEALQGIESLVNKNNTATECETKLLAYIKKLEQIKSNLSVYFVGVMNQSGLDQTTIEQIKSDLDADINRTSLYINALRNTANITSYTAARGQNSMMTFVKEQMIHGLYELQGVNQDLTYSNRREFALTRGELNDFIEDARKEIDDHQPDIRNAITAKHHGFFSEDNDSRPVCKLAGEDKEAALKTGVYTKDLSARSTKQFARSVEFPDSPTLISYDFSEDELTPQREREILLAISFIEGWDKFDSQSLTVSNHYGTESLDIYNATKWKNHRNFTAFAKSIGFYIVNFFKSIVLPTKPWEEESWSNDNFHLIAKALREHSSSNEPMWQKPIKLFKQIGYVFADIYNGVRDFGTDLVIKLPDTLVNDWNSCNEPPPLSKVLEKSTTELEEIKGIEEERLRKILERCMITPSEHHKPQSKFAAVEYALTAGEQNDILTAMARGLNDFAAVFSHNLYAKDPIGGLVFTAAFAVGAGAIYLPTATASVFGTAYVNCFSNFAYSLGSSKLTALVSGGSTQAQLLATGWDSLMHGPSGLATNALYKVGEDPLTVGAYIATATGIGYVLANGIAGYPIPIISDFLKEDLGPSPETSYPFIGAKVALLLYESLLHHKDRQFPPPEITPELIAMARSLQSTNPEHQKIINRFLLASWIAANAGAIPKLNQHLLFNLSRQIDILFDKQQSKSLNKILYPEASHSIAYQLFAIPLAYIPTVSRFIISFVLSAFALGSGKALPFEPIKRASLDLYDKISKDLSRLLVFATHMLYLVYTALSTLVKPLVYTFNMLFGRIAAFFDIKPGHGFHKVFAASHTFFRNIGEFLYPTQIIKDATVAHPTNTIMQTEESYKKLLTQIGEVKAISTEKPLSANPGHFSLTFSVGNKNKSRKTIEQNDQNAQDTSLVL
ncbi:hypothetical protein [Legionella fallonii]|uniref:Uncharacterized protein n=1 Tax=Legionella fallonii LLAP-10 TaxID=1212491 RepID=A0A098G7J3_9GAMM|nr:hypothetical protein [Legionella fallonii]CEG57485.1 conserved protein of unknown function [Legionella fallonii LLAP-10]